MDSWPDPAQSPRPPSPSALWLARRGGECWGGPRRAGDVIPGRPAEHRVGGEGGKGEEDGDGGDPHPQARTRGGGHRCDWERARSWWDGRGSADDLGRLLGLRALGERLARVGHRRPGAQRRVPAVANLNREQCQNDEEEPQAHGDHRERAWQRSASPGRVGPRSRREPDVRRSAGWGGRWVAPGSWAARASRLVLSAHPEAIAARKRRHRSAEVVQLALQRLQPRHVQRREAHCGSRARKRELLADHVEDVGAKQLALARRGRDSLDSAKLRLTRGDGVLVGRASPPGRPPTPRHAPWRNCARGRGVLQTRSTRAM